MDIGKFLDENNHGGIIEENDFFNHPEMKITENVIEEKKPEIHTWKWRKEISKDLMKGKHAQYIYKKYGKLITDSKNFDKIVKFIDTFDGLIGTILMDCSTFDTTFKFEDVPYQNRQYGLYAINAKNIGQHESVSYGGGNDGTLDGFLNGNEKKEVFTYEYDKDTGLGIIHSLGEIDQEGLFQVALLMVETGKMTQKQFEGFKKSKSKLNFVKKVFRGDFRKTLNAPINNDVSDFGLKSQKINAVPSAKAEAVNVSVTEKKLDAIEVVESPDKINITIKKDKREDLPDFDVFAKKSSVNVEELKEEKLDDIGQIKNTKIEIDNDVKEVNDGLNGLFDDLEISNANKQEIDEDEFFSQDNTEEEIEFDAKPKKQDISNNYGFGW
jgi:hypothetical protein